MCRRTVHVADQTQAIATSAHETSGFFLYGARGRTRAGRNSSLGAQQVRISRDPAIEALATMSERKDSNGIP